MAMVVRHALGLSATAGQVAVFFNNSLSGQIAIATARHLRNAGARIHLIALGDPKELGSSMQRQLRFFGHDKTPLLSMIENFDSEELLALLNSCHNVILGVCQPESENSGLPWHDLITLLNEQPTPVHTIIAPIGINLDSGANEKTALIASSTLSLGVPLQALLNCTDYIGRHYLCDISITPELYQEFKLDYQAAFAEQPVIQIFRAK